MQPVPTWLHTPPLSAPPRPPASTRAQELPFGDITWEAFEKLCLRLAFAEADVVDCRQYGVRGDDQEGIDLFARLQDGGYATYQCKRVQGFSPRLIKGAVSEFKGGEWYPRSRRFVLCTSESLGSRVRSDAVRDAAATLGGTDLVVWDADALSLSLKDHPDLVDDFFGRAWAEAFNGPEAAHALGQRLDAAETADLRLRLGRFYASVFAKHDPGILNAGGAKSQPLPLSRRYVPPDVFVTPLADPLEQDAPALPPLPTAGLSLLNIADDYVDLIEGGRVHPPEKTVPVAPSSPEELRVGIDEWLGRSQRSVVLAGPGGGKSALLRVVALDVLSEAPRLPGVARRWGQRIPVWLPFGRWTRTVGAPEPGAGSLSDALQGWFHEFAADDLWPLVSRALSDERLLLLVDGLDEWTSEEAGAIAVQRLQVFVEHHNVPAIVTSRPHGFERLPIGGETWQVARLAPLSDVQRGAIAQVWFAHWEHESGELPDVPDAVRRTRLDVDALEADLARTPDLDELSRVPLLLSLLIRLRREQARLPTSRFKAYDALVDVLLRDQPRVRQRAASRADALVPDLSDEDLRGAFARLAWAIQTDHPSGILSNTVALRILVGYLEDGEVGPAMSPERARSVARTLVEAGQETLGLLRPASPREVTFFHRSLQQALAASALAERPVEHQVATVTERYDDPQWREVLLGLFASERRPDAVRSFVSALRERTQDPIGRWAAERLLAEIAFGDTRCPAGLSAEIATDTFVQIETGPRVSQREALLHIALDGLSSPRRRPDVVRRLRSWSPERSSYRHASLSALADWNRMDDDGDVRNALRRAIQDDEPRNQIASAVALCRRYAEDPSEKEYVLELVGGICGASTRAAALYAASEAWPGDPAVLECARALDEPGPLSLRVAAAHALRVAGLVRPDGWRDLLPPYDTASDSDRWWDRLARQEAALGWSGAPALRSLLIEAVQPDHVSGGWTASDAWLVLLKAFPADSEVAGLVAQHLQEDYPFIGDDDGEAWRLLEEGYRDFPVVVDAAENRLFRKREIWHRDVDAAYVARTDRVRDRLVEALTESVPHHAAQVLLDVWGLADDTVAEGFRQAALGPLTRVSDIARFLPEVMPGEAAAELLADIIEHPDVTYLHSPAAGAVKLTSTRDRSRLAEALLAPSAQSRWRNHIATESVISALVRLAPEHPQVRLLATESLAGIYPPLPAVSHAYGDDLYMRRLVLEAVAPLPVALRTVLVRRISADGALALDVLVSYNAEVETTPSLAASIGYHSALNRSGRWEEHVTEALVEHARRGGAWAREVQREAAFAGLVASERLSALVARAGPTPVNRYDKFRITDYLDNLQPFRHLVLDRWAYLFTVLPEPIHWFTTLWGGKGAAEVDAVWRAFARSAAPFSDARKAVLNHIREVEGDDPLSLLFLRFLAEADPSSPTLLDQSLAATVGGSDAAAFLFAQSFGGRADVLARLDQHVTVNEAVPTPVALAVVEGWPRSALAERILADANDRLGKEGIPWSLYFSLGSHAGSPAWALRLLKELDPATPLDSTPWRDTQTRNQGTRALIRFLSRTPEAVAYLLNELTQGDTSTYLSTNIPRLVASAVGVPTELRTWAETLLGTPEAGVVPALGYDLLSHSVRPLRASLLDVVRP